MALVECAFDLYTTAQKPGESTEVNYKIFIARKDTVNAHGGEVGRHAQLYMLARQQIMDKLDMDNIYMADHTNLVVKIKIEAEAKAKSSKAFLACLFVLMADNKRYKPLKDQLDNDYLLGRDRAPHTNVEAKQLLADYIMPQRRSGGGT